MSKVAIDIALAGVTELAEVNAFYRQCGYGAVASDAERVFIARAGQQLVGAVRLCVEQGVTVLRGMQVHPDFQRQGIGANLLVACTPFLDERAAFCLPYTHLLSFYARAGFVEIAADALPEFLAARLASYQGRGQQVLAMTRAAGC